MATSNKSWKSVARLCKQNWHVAVLGLLVGLFFWRLILLGEVFVPADILSRFHPWRNYRSSNLETYNHYASDIIDSQYPARAVARHIIYDGQLPLWDPYTSSGRPLGIVPIYALSFPLNFLLVLLPLDLGFSYQAALRLLIAGIGMFAFLRQLKLGKLSSLVGGIIFAFNGFLIVWLNATAGVTLSMAPLVFWSSERLFRKPSAMNLALLAASVATLISGGFLQVVLYILYSLVGYLIFRVGLEIWELGDWRVGLRKLLLGGLAIALGIGMMAPQLWSFWDHMQLSSYDEGRVGVGSTHEGLTNVIRYLIPDYYGSPAAHDFYGVYPELMGYVGILPIFLAALAMAFAWRRYKPIWFFAFLLILAIGMLYGAPFNKLVVLLPGLNVSASLRIKSVIALCMSTLSAFGLELLLRQTPASQARKKLLAVLVSVILLQLVIITLTEVHWSPAGSMESGGHGEPRDNIFENSLWRLWSRSELEGHHLFKDSLRYLLWAFGSLTLLTAGAKGFISKRMLGLGALLLVSLDLVGWSMTYYRPVDREDVFRETPGIAFLKSDPEPFRVTGLDYVLRPNTPSAYQLQDIAGHDPLAPDRYRNLLARIDRKAQFGVHGTLLLLHPNTTDLSSPLLDMLNLKYLAEPPEAPSQERITQDGTFVPVYNGPDMTIYENTDALPRSYIVSQVQVVSDPQDILDLLTNGQINPREIVLLEEEPTAFVQDTSNPVTHPTSEIVSYTPNRVVVQTETSTSAFLVLNDTYYPGWEAKIDGQQTKIYRANYIFRAVYLPPGSHVVEFAFLPRPYYIGLAIRWAIAVGLVVAVIWAMRMRRKAIQNAGQALHANQHSDREAVS